MCGQKDKPAVFWDRKHDIYQILVETRMVTISKERAEFMLNWGARLVRC